MIKYILFLGLLSISSSLSSQQEGSVAVKPYWDIAISANVWTAGSKTVGIQTTGGAIINRTFTVGFGLGVGSRNYEYINLPIELGFIIWDGNGAVRIYGGPTYQTYGSETGFLGGTEIVFRPRFEMRNLKLLLALGMAFDESGPGYFSFSQPSVPEEKTFMSGPRLRIGLGL